MKFLYCLFLTILSICTATNSYKILGVFPTMAKSHYIVGSSLMKGLAEKGHEVTMISPFPQKTPLKNWRDISTPGVLEATKSLMDNIIHLRDQGTIESIVSLFGMGLNLTKLTLNEPSVQQFLQTKQKFDVVVMEVFVNEADLGFASTFDAPVVGISTFGSNIWVNDMVGTPAPLSYVPNPFVPLTNNMNFIQRLANVGISLVERIYNDLVYLPQQKELFEKMFPNNNKVNFYDLRKNVSLVLLNSHFSVGYPKPYVPNMIEVGGMHINRKLKPLPPNIKKFLDEAKDGAIYFSMGSNLKSKTLPLEVRKALIKTFSNIKQRVLWKFEADLPEKPENVFISDWFPQDDILAHPNVKLFITHGGLLSTMESMYHGVPIVGIPMFGDQFLNMARAENAGFGVAVSYDSLNNEKALTAAISKVIANTDYKTKMMEVSKRYRDQPMQPLETAVYWVEYVARHKGAPHLKSAAQELSFIQYHNLDVFALILLVLYLIYSLLRKMLKALFGLCSKTNNNSTSSKGTKKSKKNN